MGAIANIRREARYLRGIIRTLRRLSGLKPDSDRTVADIIEGIAEKKPDNIAIYFDDREITFREYNEWGNRYAHWALSQGIGKGDVVSLMMENRPEFLFAWLGLAKVGAVASLINTNLQGHPLSHSLEIAGAKHVILGAELAENFSSAADLMDERPTVWATGGNIQGAEDLDAALDAASPGPVPDGTREGLKAADKLFYIYTSGTTGLPKAANISHFRFQMMAHGFSGATNAKEDDRMYVVLPLYHSAGGICAIGATLTVGGSVVIRRKFSAHHFWADARKYQVTLFQYIGELCRYLVNTPEHPDERKHNIRIAVGNGLRPDVWPEFQERFQIPQVIEFYGATEGNVALVNTDGKVGAVGRIPKYMERVFNSKLVRFDVETEQPVRGADGFCIECAPGEIGEAIGKIDDSDPRARFEGYSKKEESEKKILRDVFEKGDAWFRTGDLLKRDEEGYYYFIDRIGDTFRWKGENVATSEVAEVISVFPGVKEANVYGVQVPGADGRAGMVSIVAEENFDLDRFRSHIDNELPDYAQPVFVRLQPAIDVTATFKHRKVELVKEGFDPKTVSDPLYFNDKSADRFVPLDPGLHQKVVNGEVRL